jgi:hypothetical protein
MLALKSCQFLVGELRYDIRVAILESLFNQSLSLRFPRKPLEDAKISASAPTTKFAKK